MMGALLTPRIEAQTVAARDKVILVGGKVLQGRILLVSNEHVVLREGSVDRTFPRKVVQSIESVAVRHRELLAAWQNVNVANADDLLAIAARADLDGLPYEARLLRFYALLARPADPAIHKALGNRAQGAKFQVEIGGHWVLFEAADALGVDFSNAWQLRSEHFAIRCAAGLRTGLDTLMDLEGFYWLFHELFGSELQLLELTEPLEVRLYRQRDQMPNLSDNVSAYFSVSEIAMYTCVENGRPHALFHEGTHALLYCFFVRATKSRGVLPAWLDEGWAEYMDARIQTSLPGKPKLRARSINSGHSAQLVTAGRDHSLYSVHALLNMKTGDFMASTKQACKYAQSWALFCYLFENTDPEIRGLFIDYLHKAASGQGQASTFRKLFVRFEKLLETQPWKV